MKINAVKYKQVKKGVYALQYGGEIVVANYQYNLPPKSVVMPGNNIVIVTAYKGNYAWRYIDKQDVWRIWQISSDNIKDAIYSVKYRPFDMAVKMYEGNKALMMIRRSRGETTRYSQEWRYYTKFFSDLVRKK